MNKPVQVTIAEPYDSVVECQLESGVFKSAEDVVEAGLKLLKEEQARIECENSGPSVPFDREEFKALMRERHLRSRASQESKLLQTSRRHFGFA